MSVVDSDPLTDHGTVDEFPGAGFAKVPVFSPTVQRRVRTTVAGLLFVFVWELLLSSSAGGKAAWHDVGMAQSDPASLLSDACARHTCSISFVVAPCCCCSRSSAVMRPACSD